MEQRKIKAVILKNELENDHLLWVNACTYYSENISYRVVELTADNWLYEIQNQQFDILLAKPGGLTSRFKTLYDERIYVLERCLGYKVYPCAEEIFIYENKRFLSFWLEANRIPHPTTHVFYQKQEALSFLQRTSYPIVAKVNIGASGSGVVILKKSDEASAYVKETFEGKGAKQRTGPNLKNNGLLKRGIYYFFHLSEIISKLNVYQTLRENRQIGFVIFQEYVPHDYEWRVVRIGASFFAHKKLKIGEKASGSLLKNYDNPPLRILDFVKEITDTHNLFSQAIDIFEVAHENYLVNEMQCIFGQSDSFQMLVDGVEGRYLKINNEWKFEKGDFNANESYNLRIQTVIDMFPKNNLPK